MGAKENGRLVGTKNTGPSFDVLRLFINWQLLLFDLDSGIIGFTALLSGPRAQVGP